MPLLTPASAFATLFCITASDAAIYSAIDEATHAYLPTGKAVGHYRCYKLMLRILLLAASEDNATPPPAVAYYFFC